MLVKGSSVIPGNLSEYIIKITTLENKEYDITKAAYGFQLFQDILAPYWTGSIWISDTSNMITNLPIEEGNKITLTWGTEFELPTSDCKGNKTLEVYIYEISDRSFINRDLTSYSIKFATKEFFLNKKKRLSGKLPPIKNSKSNYTELPENVIKSIIKNNFGDEYSFNSPSKSDKSYSIDANNWSPFTAIIQLTKFALYKDQADYLFFRNSFEPGFLFESISELYNNKKYETGIKFLQKPANLKDENGTDPDIMNSILNFKIKHYNTSQNKNSGFDGNKILSFDFVTKSIQVKSTKRDYGRKQSDLIKDSESSSIIFQPKHLQIGAGDINQSQDKWLANRRMNLMKLEQDKLIIQIYGSICSTTWLGKTCEIVFPNLDDYINPDARKDENYSGKYLITSICQDVNLNKYLVNLSLVKIKE